MNKKWIPIFRRDFSACHKYHPTSVLPPTKCEKTFQIKINVHVGITTIDEREPWIWSSKPHSMHMASTQTPTIPKHLLFSICEPPRNESTKRTLSTGVEIFFINFNRMHKVIYE